MISMRPSVREDIPRLRLLWQLAFGDGEEYLENFFAGYYQPQYVLVLESEGEIQAMTAWFGSALVMPDGNRWRCAYLYAVATHPQRQGEGFAGALLKYCDFYLREHQSFQALSTVPARPDLHVFFGRNGFRECFVQSETEVVCTDLPRSGRGELRPVEAEEYRRLREKLLHGTAHIDLDPAGIAYQAGACALSGGGVYHYQGGTGEALICVEGAGTGTWYVKELLGDRQVGPDALALLPAIAPGERYYVRRPGGDGQFGMLKWLYPGLEARWDWSATAYLGPGFD